jgi:hypothetical protein
MSFDSSDILFFFGAGASAPFGIPTMKKFVIDFEELLDKTGAEKEKELYRKIKRELQNHLNREVDLEDVFTVIDGLHNFDFERLGTLAVFCFSKHLSPPDYLYEKDTSNCESLNKKFQDFVREKCQIPEKSFNEIYTVYQDFFNTVYDKTSRTSSDTHRTKGNHKYCTTWSMFTTNYDLCLEYYWRQRAEISLNTGFSFDTIKNRVILNPQNFLTDSRSSGRPKLIKLHGSINWSIEDDGTITEQVVAPYQPYLGQRYVGELMIYPVQQKELYVEPYVSMLLQLNRELSKKSTWIIIGYSFNDPVIQEIFIKNSDDSKRIILVHPSASDIQYDKLNDINCKDFLSLHQYFGRQHDYKFINKDIAEKSSMR